MRRAWLLGAAAGFAALTAAHDARAYDRLVVIGDSYSDTGNARIAIPGAVPSPPYYDGRFSNGSNYIDVLSQHLGLPTTASLLGGTDYAYGTAVTGPAQASPLGTAVVPSLSEQLATYLAATGGQADPYTLYVVEGGTNDIFGGLAQLKGTSGAGADAMLAGVAAAGAANIAAIEAQLIKAGARSILTVNVPDLALEPITRASTFSGLPAEAMLAGAAASAFNADVVADLAPFRNQAILSYLDLHALEASIVGAPASYGFADVTDPCFLGGGLTPDGSVVCASGTENSHLFWDPIHISGRTNAIIAAAALYALPARCRRPGQVRCWLPASR